MTTKNKNATNKRSLNDEVAKSYLTLIRKSQRQSEEAWRDVRFYELKLRDYLNNQPPKTDSEYASDVSSIELVNMVEDQQLVDELVNRIGHSEGGGSRKKLKLLVRGYVARDLTTDKEGVEFVEIELNGKDEDESIEIV